MVKIFYTLLCFIIIFNYRISIARPPQNNIKFIKTFGFCPTGVGGEFSQKLFDEFKIYRSLEGLKNLIVQEKLAEKSFLSDYKISYSPVLNQFTVKIDCPLPLLKVRIYSSNSDKLKRYGLLVSNGAIFDPTYEIFLREDKRKISNIPEMSINSDFYNAIRLKKMASFLLNLPPILSDNMSEIFYDNDKTLNLIFSLLENPVLVVLKEENLISQIDKMEKIFKYFLSKKKIPSVVNLKDSKKIVVKFPTKI